MKPHAIEPGLLATFGGHGKLFDRICDIGVGHRPSGTGMPAAGNQWRAFGQAIGHRADREHGRVPAGLLHPAKSGVPQLRHDARAMLLPC